MLNGQPGNVCAVEAPSRRNFLENMGNAGGKQELSCERHHALINANGVKDCRDCARSAAKEEFPGLRSRFPSSFIRMQVSINFLVGQKTDFVGNHARLALAEKTPDHRGHIKI